MPQHGAGLKVLRILLDLIRRSHDSEQSAEKGMYVIQTHERKVKAYFYHFKKAFNTLLTPKQMVFKTHTGTQLSFKITVYV